MSISERLVEDLKTAMKAGDKLRVTTIRGLRAAFQSAQLEAAKQQYDAAVRTIEARSNPKAELYEALRKASGLTGRRLAKFRPAERVHRLGELISDFSPLRLLPAFQALEHTDHPWRVVTECFRVTKPGGRCILTAPFLFPHHSSPHDYFRFSHEGLASLATDAGYVVDEVVPQCGSLQTVMMLLAWYNMFPTGWARKLTRSTQVGKLYGASTTIPLNMLGLLAGAIPYGKKVETGNLGFSNFMLGCSRPLASGEPGGERR